MFDLAILGGTLVTPTQTQKANLYARGGRIAAITADVLEEGALETIDATGLFVYPGFIDTHVHSRDGGATHKEDFLHSTTAAACGGITTICEMPNAIPAVIDAEAFAAQKANLCAKAVTDFALWGLCIGGRNNDKLVELAGCGVGAFKFFWGYAINKTTYGLVYNYDPADTNMIPPMDDGEVFSIFQAVAKTGKPIAIHAENANLIRELTDHCVVGDYKNEYEALLHCRPALAEVLVVQTAIEYSKATGVHLHILHISAKETVGLLREAKKAGVNVTGETCPHYLCITADDYGRIGNMIKCYPPVRYQADQDALWAGIADGTLSLVCSDHAPHTEKEKNDSLFKIPSGMCSTESMAPLMIDAVNAGKLDKNRLAAILSQEPAKLFGLYPRKGSLQVGTDADITIVDFEKAKTIRAADLHSISKVTAYDGVTVKGLPVYTILRGQVIAKEGEPVTGKPTGQFVEG
ncbi:MAG: dihydroorotase [Lachnospiraceae bacterium]|jgi:allantoinase|nr:dihydroorotase [Lachnospiraceae bacterium]